MSTATDDQPARPGTSVHRQVHFAEPTPQPTQSSIFTPDEETESFYVIVDLSGDDFSTTDRYRNGRKIRTSGAGTTDATGDNDDEDADNEDRERSVVDEDQDLEDDDDDDEEEEEAEDNDEDEDGYTSSLSSDDELRESALQLLDLDSYTPLINYEGRIYQCHWSISNGTELIFQPPASSASLPLGSPAHMADADAEGEDDDEEDDENDRTSGTAGSSNRTARDTTNSGRRLRRDLDEEATLLGTTVFRLEGWPVKLVPKGRDKSAVASKARLFAEKLDRALEERLRKMEERGEDVSGVTMKKFSEG